MINQILTALIGNYMITAFVIGIIVALVRVMNHREQRSAEFISGTFLNSFVFWAIGIAETLNFVMHSVSVTTPRQASGGRRAPSSWSSRCAASA